MSVSATSLPDSQDCFVWQTLASCAGLPPHIVFARLPKDAAPALRACAVCPVQGPCEETIAPADTWFDGVCAGRLWRNGRPVSTVSEHLGSAHD